MQQPASHAAAVAPPQLFENGRSVPAVNERVEYNSETYSCWLPTTVKAVNEETGEVTVEVKPNRPWRPSELRAMLRPRTKPSEAQLRWVRSVLAEGRSQEEAAPLFEAHAVLHEGEKFIAWGTAPAVGAEIDRLTGSPVAVPPLLHELAAAPNRLLGWEGFAEIFLGVLGDVEWEFGDALPREELRRRQGDAMRSYKIWQECAGRGTYGKVMQVVSKANGCRRALKVIEKEKLRMSAVQAEVDCLCALDHPHIVRLHEYFVQDNKVSLVTDFCSGGDLQKALNQRAATGKRFPEDYIRDVLRQTLRAVAHVHARGIVHLDIKPANIMLMPSKRTLPPGAGFQSGTATLAEEHAKPHVVLIDLGVAQLFRPGDYTNGKVVGTPYTMAPEVWTGVITPKADVFSVGVVHFQLLCLRVPVEVPPTREEGAKFWAAWGEEKQVDLSPLRFNSPEAQRVAQGMLRIQRGRRPTSAGALASDFLKEEKPREVMSKEMLEQVLRVPERSLLYKSVAMAAAREWAPNEMPAIERAFTELTKDTAGVLPLNRFARQLQRLGAEAGAAWNAASAMDLDKDGCVGFREFVAACAQMGSEDLEACLWGFFQDAEGNGDQLLSLEDLAKLMPKCSQEAVAEAFRRLDSGKGVDWQSFRAHFQATDGLQQLGAAAAESEAAAGQAPQGDSWGLKGFFNGLKQNLLGAPGASPVQSHD